MIPSLQEFDPGIGDPEHHAVLVIEAPGPLSTQRPPQGFGLADSLEGIAARCLDQIEQPKRYFPVGFNPKCKIGQKVAIEERLTLPGQTQSPTSRRNSSIVIFRSWPRFARRMAPSSRLALFGDRSR